MLFEFSFLSTTVPLQKRILTCLPFSLSFFSPADPLEFNASFVILGFFLETRDGERKEEREKEGEMLVFFSGCKRAKIRGNVTLRVEKFDGEGRRINSLIYGIEKRIGTLSLLEAFDLGDGYNEKLRGRVGNEVSLPG